MENQDLELAKQKLIKENLTLVIVKNQKVVFDTKNPGINGFLQAIETLKQDLNDSSILSGDNSVLDNDYPKKIEIVKVPENILFDILKILIPSIIAVLLAWYLSSMSQRPP